jgi:ABC-2 type transport system permease protein
MPVTSVEIMLAKIWSTALIVLAAAWCSLTFVVRGTLHVPVEGSVLLFLALSALHLLATTSMGLLMATMARTMPQFGMAFLLTVMPLQVLSGGLTPRESMPDAVQLIMNVAPTTHFVAGSQAILFRGAGLDVIWPRLLALVAIGAGCFALALWRFPASLRQRG